MNASPRTLVVTGAAGALGQAVVAEMGPGTNLVLINRSVSPAPHGVLSLAADVTSDAEVAHAAGLVAKRFGQVDVFVHVAGGFEMGDPVHTLSREAWDRMMDLNAWSFVNVAKHLVPLMRGEGGGRIVAVSAAAAARGEAHKGAYAASKAALQRLVESMAAELQGEGFTVNSVAPTVLDTPANRAAMPDADPAGWTSLADAARAIAFLASDAGRAVNGRHLVLG
jgi:NAD(P)-dependent dehydrogenase (short-subunit alcohol dehydrogenase family)